MNKVNSIAKEISFVVNEIKNVEQAEIVESLVKSKSRNSNIFLAGAGRSLLVIKTFAMRLMHLGFSVHVVGDVTTPAIKKGDVLIIGSGSGETNILKNYVKKTEEVGADVILITRSPKSTIANKSRTVINIPIQKIETIQPSGSIFEQSMFLLFDALTLMIMEELKLGYEQTIDDFIRIRHANLE